MSTEGARGNRRVYYGNAPDEGPVVYVGGGGAAFAAGGFVAADVAGRAARREARYGGGADPSGISDPNYPGRGAGGMISGREVYGSLVRNSVLRLARRAEAATEKIGGGGGEEEPPPAPSTFIIAGGDANEGPVVIDLGSGLGAAAQIASAADEDDAFELLSLLGVKIASGEPASGEPASAEVADLFAEQVRLGDSAGLSALEARLAPAAIAAESAAAAALADHYGRGEPAPGPAPREIDGGAEEDWAARARSLRGAADLRALLAEAPADFARPLADFAPGTEISVDDRMQRGYAYTLEAAPGADFAEGFEPELAPAEMLAAGVFEGKYLNDCVGELPREWFEDALAADTLRPGSPDPSINEFGVKSRKSLGYWREKGWLPAVPPGDDGVERDPDVRGWFQWYCRYWLGRRAPAVDAVQVKRWRAFRRHAGQVRAAYRRLEQQGKPVPKTRAEKRKHRAKQRQALLQWAYDPWL